MNNSAFCRNNAIYFYRKNIAPQHCEAIFISYGAAYSATTSKATSTETSL